MRRRGPRPIGLHLLPGWPESNNASNSAWPPWNAGWPSWSGVDPELIAGIAAYRRHPYQRPPEPPPCWQLGGSHIRDYGQHPERGMPAILFVPSLINRGTVLDLLPGHSMLRNLAARGIRPFLLEWGWPDAPRRGFTLADHVTQILEPAIAATAAMAGGPIILAGYCMGGLLAIAAATRDPRPLRAIALLATPWDFHAPDPHRAARIADALPALEPALQATSTLPVDLLQCLFAAADPRGIARKYRAFGRLPQDGARAALFVALEDWLNDGTPLPAPVARECLEVWYGANAPGRGQWRLAGGLVDPGSLTLPAFIAIPDQDRIVPPDSALSLARIMPHAALHRPGAGHVGMVAGPRAETALWRIFADWIAQLPPL